MKNALPFIAVAVLLLLLAGAVAWLIWHSKHEKAEKKEQSGPDAEHVGDWPCRFFPGAGRSIEIIAVITTLAGIASSICGCAALFAAGAIGYAILCLIAGIFSSIASGYMIFGFGQLVDDVHKGR